MQTELVYCLAVVKSRELNIIGRKSSIFHLTNSHNELGAHVILLHVTQVQTWARLVSGSSCSTENLTDQITGIYRVYFLHSTPC